jgi:D-glycero-D-manno-heptose 1,7-bisphosphate phosphatase
VRPAVFVDRDGTINEECDYLNNINGFKLLPDAERAISLLNKNNYLVVVISNQSGAARGYFPVELVTEINDLMRRELAKGEAFVDEIYFCPHHPDGVIPEYSKECDCRKPNTGLIEKARSELDIDMEGSYVIGDRWLDIECAHNANLPGILVLTGYGMEELQCIATDPQRIKPAFVAKDLLAAVQWILDRDNRNER